MGSIVSTLDCIDGTLGYVLLGDHSGGHYGHGRIGTDHNQHLYIYIYIYININIYINIYVNNRDIYKLYKK